MPFYKVLVVELDGRILDRFEFGAANDSAAEEAAEQLGDGRARELWRGARWLRTWPPHRPFRQAARARLA